MTKNKTRRSKHTLWFVTILLIAISSGCATAPKGMQKRRKKNCDCPSFGQLDSTTQKATTYEHS